MPEVSFSCYGHVFTLPARYAAGHVITENEADALNGKMAEMISHMVRATASDAGLQKGAAFADFPEVLTACQALVAEKAASYEFGAARSGSPRVVLDPVSKKALELADKAVRAAIAANAEWKKVGKKDGSDADEPGVYPWDRFAAKRDEYAAHPKIIEKAKKAVAAEQREVEAEIAL
jgi:hypothetical protein